MRADQTEVPFYSPPFWSLGQHQAQDVPNYAPAPGVGNGRNPADPRGTQLVTPTVLQCRKTSPSAGSPRFSMIEVYPDSGVTEPGAAALLVKQANLAAAAGAGSAWPSRAAPPPAHYELLAAPWVDQVPWAGCTLLGDERCVDLNDSGATPRLAKEAWLDCVPIPADQIHP